jgi:hypothetical protein
VGIVGTGRQGDNGVNARLEAEDFVNPVLDDGIVSAEEASSNLDTIANNGCKSEKGGAGMWVRGFRRQVKFALVRVALHADGVSKGVVAFEEVEHDKELGVPVVVRGDGRWGPKEARHVVREGFDHIVLELRGKVLVDKVVEGDIKAGRSKHAARTGAFSAPWHTIDGVALRVIELVDTGGSRPVVGGELLVGLRPFSVDAVKDSLSLELVEALDGILGADSISHSHMRAGYVAHAFGPTPVAKAVLADTNPFLDRLEGFVGSHAFQSLLKEGGARVDWSERMLFASCSVSSLGGAVGLVQCGHGPMHK